MRGGSASGMARPGSIMVLWLRRGRPVTTRLRTFEGDADLPPRSVAREILSAGAARRFSTLTSPSAPHSKTRAHRRIAEDCGRAASTVPLVLGSLAGRRSADGSHTLADSSRGLLSLVCRRARKDWLPLGVVPGRDGTSQRSRRSRVPRARPRRAEFFPPHSTIAPSSSSS